MRQQLLHVDIFEVQVPLQMELEDEWVGRLGATVLNPLPAKSRRYCVLMNWISNQLIKTSQFSFLFHIHERGILVPLSVVLIGSPSSSDI